MLRPFRGLKWIFTCHDRAACTLPRPGLAIFLQGPLAPSVCSRKDTGKTARMLALKAQQSGEQNLFDCTLEDVSCQGAPALIAKGLLT